MAINFRCQKCRQLLTVAFAAEGKKCKCPKCFATLQVPKTDAEVIEVVGSVNEDTFAGGQIEVSCPGCERTVVASKELIGTKGQCRGCQAIFVISDDVSENRHQIPEHVFNCPNCEQLFEGTASMANRPGRCHNCNEVFRIELKPNPFHSFEVAELADDYAGHDGPLIVAELLDAESTTDDQKPTSALAETEPIVLSDAYEFAVDDETLRLADQELLAALRRPQQLVSNRAEYIAARRAAPTKSPSWHYSTLGVLLIALGVLGPILALVLISFGQMVTPFTIKITEELSTNDYFVLIAYGVFAMNYIVTGVLIIAKRSLRVAQMGALISAIPFLVAPVLNSIVGGLAVWLLFTSGKHDFVD